jgi:HEAT repeat protein
MVSVDRAPYCRATMGDSSNADQPGVAELRSALASLDPSTRARALLRAPPGPHVERLMVEALDDPEPQVRLAAVQALARLGGPGGTRALMRVAAGDPSPAVRAEALAGLSEILQARSRNTRPRD